MSPIIMECGLDSKCAQGMGHAWIFLGMIVFVLLVVWAVCKVVK